MKPVQPKPDYQPREKSSEFSVNNLPISMMNPLVIHRSKNSIMVAGLREKYKIDRVSHHSLTVISERPSERYHEPR